MGAVMMKKGIHPEWHPEAKVRMREREAAAAVETLAGREARGA